MVTSAVLEAVNAVIISLALGSAIVVPLVWLGVKYETEDAVWPGAMADPHDIVGWWLRFLLLAGSGIDSARQI